MWPILAILFGIGTLVFGWMALSPSTAPVKTGGAREVAATGTEDEIEDVSRRFTENLLTYKPSTAEADIGRARNDGTDELGTRQLAAFRSEDGEGLTLDQIVRDVEENNATSSVDVKATAITSRDESTATVVVVTQRTIDSDEREQPSTGLLVVELTLLKSDDGWKVDDIASPATTN